MARRGLSLVVLGEWHNPAVLRSVRFFDDNTHAWMEPITGGANLPALNELLGPLGVAFGSQVCHDERTLTLTLTTYDLPLGSTTYATTKVLRGELRLGEGIATIASGAPIARLAAGGWLLRVPTMHDEAAALAAPLGGVITSGIGSALGGSPLSDVPMLGLLELQAPGAGRVAAFGDTECIDSEALTPSASGGRAAVPPCWWLLQAMLEFAGEGRRDPVLFPPSSQLRCAHPAAEPGTASADLSDLPRRDAVPPLGVHSRSARDAPCLLERLGLASRAAAPPPPFGGGGGRLPLPFGGLAEWPFRTAFEAAAFASASASASDSDSVLFSDFGASEPPPPPPPLSLSRANAPALIVLATMLAALVSLLAAFRCCRRSPPRRDWSAASLIGVGSQRSMNPPSSCSPTRLLRLFLREVL